MHLPRKPAVKRAGTAKDSWPGSMLLYQQTAGFLACRSLSWTTFPVFKPVAVIADMALNSLLTVTSSHRTCTCFPFTCGRL